jgi:hypothetical protein
MPLPPHYSSRMIPECEQSATVIPDSQNKMADTASGACRVLGASRKGYVHLDDLTVEAYTCDLENLKKPSQARFAMALRTTLSRRRTNPRAYVSFPECAQCRDSCVEV